MDDAPNPALRKLAAIIPYYQREAGILRRAMHSILSQALPLGASVHVFIIDDASPCPLATDLTDLPERPDVTYSVHSQPNGGPGAARNTGLALAEADGGFAFVAFLDSDDEWLPRHLADALDALDSGYDFYFCDNARDGSFDHYSDQLHAMRNHGAAIADRSVTIRATGPVLGFAPGSLCAEMITEYMAQTSTIVLRSSTIPGWRFDVSQRAAGEDHLFWILLAKSDVRIAISWACNVRCGKGVNIYFSAFDWDNPATLDRVGHVALLADKLCRMSGLTPPSLLAAKEIRTKYKRAYSFLFIRTLLKRKLPSMAVLKRITRNDFSYPILMPVMFLQTALDRSKDTRTW